MISVKIMGTEPTLQMFGALQTKAMRSLGAAMLKIAIKLQARVKSQKLTGQVLHVRTGRLRRSITRKVETTRSNIIATVGTNVSYGRVHEYGFRGKATIREHLRATKNGAKARVRAHTRDVNYPERSFLRSALRDMRGEIQRDLSVALKDAVRRK